MLAVSGTTATSLFPAPESEPKISLTVNPCCQWPQPELSAGPRCGSMDLIGRYKCWEIKDGSPAHLLWKMVSKKIISLLEEQFEVLEARDHKLMVEMYMIGRRPTSSKPTVVVSCESKIPRLRAMQLIERQGILMPYPGVFMAHCSRLPRSFTERDDLKRKFDFDVYLDELNGKLSHCGMPILVEGISSILHHATLGGIVRIFDSYYGLTTEHAFLGLVEKEEESPWTSDFDFEFFPSEQSFDDYGSDSDDDSESENILSYSINTSSPQEDYETKVPKRFAQASSQSQPHTSSSSPTSSFKLGSLCVASANESTLDWALVTIEDRELLFSLTHEDAYRPCLDETRWKENLLYPKSVAPTCKSADVLIATTTPSLPRQATLSEIIAFQKSSGDASFNELWKVNTQVGELGPGDSGAWVIDANNGALYGHILSGHKNSRSAYLSPAIKTFSDIEVLLGIAPDTVKLLKHPFQPRKTGILPNHPTTAVSKATTAYNPNPPLSRLHHTNSALEHPNQTSYALLEKLQRPNCLLSNVLLVKNIPAVITKIELEMILLDLGLTGYNDVDFLANESGSLAIIGFHDGISAARALEILSERKSERLGNIACGFSPFRSRFLRTVVPAITSSASYPSVSFPSRHENGMETLSSQPTEDDGSLSPKTVLLPEVHQGDPAKVESILPLTSMIDSHPNVSSSPVAIPWKPTENWPLSPPASRSNSGPKPPAPTPSVNYPRYLKRTLPNWPASPPASRTNSGLSPLRTMAKRPRSPPAGKNNSEHIISTPPVTQLHSHMSPLGPSSSKTVRTISSNPEIRLSFQSQFQFSTPSTHQHEVEPDNSTQWIEIPAPNEDPTGTDSGMKTVENVKIVDSEQWAEAEDAIEGIE